MREIWVFIIPPRHPERARLLRSRSERGTSKRVVMKEALLKGIFFTKLVGEFFSDLVV
jgi:hypothetical protein